MDNNEEIEYEFLKSKNRKIPKLDFNQIQREFLFLHYLDSIGF